MFGVRVLMFPARYTQHINSFLEVRGCKMISRVPATLLSRLSIAGRRGIHATKNTTSREYCTSSSSTPSSNTPKRRIFPLTLAAIALPSAYITYSTLYSHDKDDESVVSEDTEKLYRSKTTSEIVFSLAILKLCSIQQIVHYGPRALAFLERVHLSAPAYWVMKKTFFKNFCAGSTVSETEKVVDKLRGDAIGVVLDYSVEASDGVTSHKEMWNQVTDDVIKTIHLASKDPSLGFSVVKVTGLTSDDFLKRYNRYLTKESPEPLTESEKVELNELYGRLHRICKATADAGVPLLVDAEQTYFQTAIDEIAINLCKQYNKSRPLIYNTYQLYRKDTLSRLQKDINDAKSKGYKLGVKLVRGAYMVSERQHAADSGKPDPIHSTIAETHKSYHDGLDIALKNLGTTGVMIATHNEASIEQGIATIKKLRINSQNRDIQFAQLYGMGDHLTLLLVQSGQRVFKYVPYGPIECVMPYLIRRMQENTGFIGSTSAKERALLRKELRRRVTGK